MLEMPLKLMKTAGNNTRKQEFNEVNWSVDHIPRVLIPVANGSHDIEVVTIVDILRRAKVDVMVASVEKSLQILAARGTKIVADKLINDAAEYALLGALSINCHNLEELGLQGCTNTTDAGLVILVEGCQRLKYLDISKCSNVGDIGISSISKACSASLKTLKLLDCYKLGDGSILSLAKLCKNLETLIIGGCRNISNESIKSLAAACNVNLKILRMDWCLNVFDSSLNCILSRCRSLEALDIGCCEEVTDAAFQGLDSEGFELALKILKVSNCTKIIVAGIGMFLKSCKTLEYLDVRSCPHVTKAGCDEAGLHFPTCCKVNFAGSLAEPDVLI